MVHHQSTMSGPDSSCSFVYCMLAVMDPAQLLQHIWMTSICTRYNMLCSHRFIEVSHLQVCRNSAVQVWACFAAQSGFCTSTKLGETATDGK